MRIGLGSDQIGFECKERLKARFAGQGHSAEDVCLTDLCGSDYQSITDQLSSALYTSCVERGVLICSRAIGASVMANKHPGVRAALCHDVHSARQGVQDDGVNLLVMRAGVVAFDLACELADAFVQASYLPCEQEFGMPPRRLARVVEYNRISPSCSSSVPAWRRISSFCRSELIVRRSFCVKATRRLSRSRLEWASRIRRTSQLCLGTLWA